MNNTTITIATDGRIAHGENSRWWSLYRGFKPPWRISPFLYIISISDHFTSVPKKSQLIWMEGVILVRFCKLWSWIIASEPFYISFALQSICQSMHFTVCSFSAECLKVIDVIGWNGSFSYYLWPCGSWITCHSVYVSLSSENACAHHLRRLFCLLSYALFFLVLSLSPACSSPHLF